VSFLSVVLSNVVVDCFNLQLSGEVPLLTNLNCFHNAVSCEFESLKERFHLSCLHFREAYRAKSLSKGQTEREVLFASRHAGKPFALSPAALTCFT